MTEDSKSKEVATMETKTKTSTWYSKGYWECQEHPGCLVSIPCECDNCTRYAEMLDIRLKEKSNQLNDRPVRNRRHSSPDIQ